MAGTRGPLGRQDRQQLVGGAGLADGTPPAGLEAAGRALWAAIFEEAAWLDGSHLAAVESLCRIEDEMAGYRQALADHGSLVEEPIVTPRGEVVGSRLVANPAEQMLRRAERSALALRHQLSLPPGDRARLGVTGRRRLSGVEDGNVKGRAAIAQLRKVVAK